MAVNTARQLIVLFKVSHVGMDIAFTKDGGQGADNATAAVSASMALGKSSARSKHALLEARRRTRLFAA